MAEETTQAAEAAAKPDGAEPHGAAQEGGQRDWKAEYEKALANSRKWEDRAKKNAEAAKELDELKAKSMTDAERADAATRRAEEAEAKVAEYERRAERDGIVAEVAEATGADAGLLARMSGDTREEIEANAALLAKAYGDRQKYPSVPDKGQQRTPQTTEEDVRKIKDPVERIRARARLSAQKRT